MPHPDIGAHWEGGHPDEGLLHEWLDEQLSAEAASHIALHVAACVECAGVVAEARGLIAASRRILSTLDEVPMNVLPANVVPAHVVGTSAGTPGASDSASPQTVAGNLGSHSSVASPTVAPQAKRVAPTPWRRIGVIAAVLVVAVATPFLLRDRSVTAPSQSISPAVSEVAQGDSGAARSGSMRAPVASPSVTKVAPAVASNDTSRDDATAKDAVANSTSADRPGASRALTGGVTAERVQAAVEAAARSVAGADITRANLAAELRADSVVPERANTVAAAGAVAKTSVESRSATQRLRTAASPMAAPPPPAVSNSLGFAGPPISAFFDSVTVMQSVCDPSCIATTLHISTQGVVRYTIGTGTSQKVVRSQLSGEERTRLGALLIRRFPAAEDRRGLVSCSVEAERPLHIDIAFGVPVVPATTPRCAASPSEVRALGDSIDAIVGARKMP